MNNIVDLAIVDDDLEINEDGTLSCVTNSNKIAQNVYIHLKLKRGSYFYNNEQGSSISYFIQNSIKSPVAIGIIASELTSIDGIESVISINGTNANRQFSINADLLDVYNNTIYVR